MRRIGLVLAVVSFSQMVFGYQMMESNTQKIERLQKNVGDMSHDGEEAGAVLAPASPLVDGEHWGLGLDYLYMDVRIPGGDFAYSNSANTSAVPIYGDVAYAKFDWTSGFRVMAQRYFSYDRWVLEGRFSFLEPQGSNSVTTTLSTGIIPLKGFLVSNTTVTLAKGNEKLNYYDVDVALKKSFFVSNDVSIEPQVGISALWLKHTLTTRYSGGGTLGLDTVTLSDTSDLFGMGPELGLSTGWMLGLGFSLEATGRALLPFGYMNTNYREVHSRIAAQRFQMKKQSHSFLPAFDGGVSFAWGGYVNEKKQFIDVAFGYDFAYFLNASQFIEATDIVTNRFQVVTNSISMQGIKAHVGVSF